MSGVAFRLRQLGGSCRHALHQDDQDGIGERDCPGSVFTLFKPVLCQRRATFFLRVDLRVFDMAQTWLSTDPSCRLSNGLDPATTPGATPQST